MTVAIVDSGVANLASVMAAMARLDADSKVTSDAGEICAASHVVFPGVGSAKAAMTQLRTKGLDTVLRQLTQPVLGICLGMQLLFAHSDESGGIGGLGVFPATIGLMQAAPGKPVPHMGWNRLILNQPDHSLLRGIEDSSFVYFVHSYAAPVSDITLASTEYGMSFSAIVGRDNFFGCQFHPERSAAVGAQILKNFLSL